jgi:hypothetical protein
MYPFCQISTKDVSKQKQKRLNTSLMPIVYNYSKFGPRFTRSFHLPSNKLTEFFVMRTKSHVTHIKMLSRVYPFHISISL